MRGARAARSVGAVVAGLAAIFVVTTATDQALHAAGVFPPIGEPWQGHEGGFVLAMLYRIVYGIAGAFLTARLAPSRPMHHALALGAVGLVFSIAGAVVMWDAGPAWYSLAVIAMALPCAWAGGRLHETSRAPALRASR